MMNHWVIFRRNRTSGKSRKVYICSGMSFVNMKMLARQATRRKQTMKVKKHQTQLCMNNHPIKVSIDKKRNDEI